MTALVIPNPLVQMVEVGSSLDRGTRRHLRNPATSCQTSLIDLTSKYCDECADMGRNFYLGLIKLHKQIYGWSLNPLQTDYKLSETF